MAFDGAYLKLMTDELSPLLAGARVDKIFQPSKTVFVFGMRNRSFSGRLLISANPSGARIQLTNTAIENPSSPPMLCMLFRKKLVGAKLLSIRREGLERIAFIDFEATNELSDKVKLTLACEVMGRCSNIILIDQNGKVIDAVRRTDASDTTRIVMPGVSYSLPSKADWLDITSTDTDKIVTALLSCGQKNLSSAMLSVMQGLSPVICREVEYRVTDGNDIPPAEYGSIYKDRLKKEINALRDIITEGKAVPTVITDKNGKPFDFSFAEITQYGTSASVGRYSSLSEALDSFYSEREQKERMHSASQDILKKLSSASSRIAKKINIRRAELEKAQNSEYKRKYGELIKANIHLIKTGDPFCTVTDYYSENLEQIKIPLNTALSPAQNAQRYFKEYRKACTACQLLEGFIQKGEQDLKYIDSVFDELSRAKSAAELSEIRSELVESGIIKKSGQKKENQKQKLIPFNRFVSSDGFEILAGKNNRQNDRLTLKESEKTDIWFHIKDSAGSHVVVRTGQKDVPDTTLTQAAIIAATLSKSSDGQGVAVDYCPVRRVKKPSGAPFGLVIYENYNTAFVTPDKELLEKLRQNVKTEEKK